MYVGQTIAIPVLDRHIRTSSGKCAIEHKSISHSCVMADAIRDRFPGAEEVGVGTSSADFYLPDGTYVSLAADVDMQRVINAFDNGYEQVGHGWTLRQFIEAIRLSAPRVVHAKVRSFQPGVGY